MSDAPWHTLLRCPVTKTPLAPAEGEVVSQLNSAIDERRLTNRAGETLERPLDGALVNADGSLAYPIFDNIPSLVAEDAISLRE